MAEQKKEEFLDEIEDSDLDQDELIDIDAEAAELEKLDEVSCTSFNLASVLFVSVRYVPDILSS